MDNSWISISTPVTLTYAYFLVQHSFINEDFIYLKENSNIIRFSGMILSIANDLGTYKVLSLSSIAKGLYQQGICLLT
ncbi:putative 1,8-cineole synthase [Lupinus albus]|uniref:Putative 1,8-cineole synthase n=1 Tax=Lupinus albus TaxID=3870 RepID=A0A6A4NRW1_LUPAL|nr:putative 1,8-cineole synthase [Lupinus albus]